MPRKTLAAALAAIVLLPLLVFVDVPEADAHERTRYRCAYDPVTNVRQCWSEKVPHTHRTIPDNPPPDTSPRPRPCPKGTTGTPPNCLPVPSDNTNRVTTTTTTTAQPKSCPAGQHSNGGAARNCHSHSFTPPCGTGTWSPGHGHSYIQRPPCPTTPPTTTQPPPVCKPGEHRYGNGCHAHSFDAPCGDGTWVPHTGHTPIQQKPCATKQDLKGITYTVKPCSSVQEPLQVVQRHKHALGNDSDETACHRADASHCPAGHTERGGHGSQDCRKNDNPDTIFTRIQHLLTQAWKTEEAAFVALMETLQKELNEASTKLEDIDWKNFATDGDEQQKLLDVINPVLKGQELEVYTIDDIKDIWADIGRYGRAGTGAAACGIAVEAVTGRLTRGRSLKKDARVAVHAVVDAACGVMAEAVPVPDTNDEKKDDHKAASSDDEQPTPTTQAPTPTTQPPSDCKQLEAQFRAAKDTWNKSRTDWNLYRQRKTLEQAAKDALINWKGQCG